MVFFSEVEGFDQSLIRLRILGFEIIQEYSAFSDHGQKPTSAVIVFFMLFQVIGKLVDALGENGDLDLGGTSVLLMLGMLDDYFLLFFAFHG